MPIPEPISSSEHSHRWEMLLDDLSRDATIVKQTISDLRAHVAGYDSVPTRSLEESVHRNIALAIRTIKVAAVPSLDQMGEADALGAERHSQGVSIGSVLAGFRVSLSVIFHRILDKALEVGIPVDQVLTTATLLWELGDAFSTRAVAVYQAKEVARAVTDSARMSEWIRNVVTSSMPAAERIRGATLYGVPTTQSVCALVAEAPPGTAMERQQVLNSWAELTETRVLTAVQGNSLVGMMLSNSVPDVQPEGITVGIGQLTLLEGVSESFDSASLALQAGLNLGMTGIVNLERLSWRMGVHASPETNEMLHNTHLAPLENSGEFGQHIEEAVDAYLSNRLSIPLAAQSIPVHVNTLRYRLKRFSELTGADLGNLDTLIEISWVLAAKQGARPEGPPS